MTTKQASEIEMAQMLYRYAQTVRCQKRRPELAAVAAEREMQFKQELERLAAATPAEDQQKAA